MAYIEDNADEDGKVTVTYDQMVDYVSSPKEKFHRSGIRDALRRLVTLGMIHTVRQTVRQTVQAPSTYQRVKWEEFQGEKDKTAQQTVQQTVLSGRRMQRKAEKKTPTVAAAPLAEVFAALAHWGVSLDAKARSFVARRVKEGMAPDMVLARCVVAKAERFNNGIRIENPMVALGRGQDGFFASRTLEVDGVRREYRDWAARRDGAGTSGGASSREGTHREIEAPIVGVPETGVDDQALDSQVHDPCGPAGFVQIDAWIQHGLESGGSRALGSVGQLGNVARADGEHGAFAFVCDSKG